MIEKFKSGNSPDGLYTSMIGFFMKAGSAIGMWITGIVLSAIGFNAEAAEQAADTIAKLKLAFGFVPAGMLAVAVFADKGKIWVAAGGDRGEGKWAGVSDGGVGKSAVTISIFLCSKRCLSGPYYHFYLDIYFGLDKK